MLTDTFLSDFALWCLDDMSFLLLDVVRAAPVIPFVVVLVPYFLFLIVPACTNSRCLSPH